MAKEITWPMRFSFVGILLSNYQAVANLMGGSWVCIMSCFIIIIITV